MSARTVSHLESEISPNRASGRWLNDCHSRLNLTRAARVARPISLNGLTEVLAKSRGLGMPVIPFGGKHAMGAQQFGTDAVAIDMRGLNRVLGLDRTSGIIAVEAGITWPEILAWLDRSRRDHGSSAGAHGWAIAQKQTGADELTIGGALAANVHGRGLSKAPVIEDVESFLLLDPDGRLIECSRTENAELFNCVIGGYGLFGLIYSVRLRLTQRKKLQRIVRTGRAETLMGRFRERIAAGFEFGDFQFQIDDRDDEFLQRGIFACYRPVPDDAEMPANPVTLQREDWQNLLYLAHADKAAAFRQYRDHYRRTDRTLHWSDSQQFTTYVDGYHEIIDRWMGQRCPGSEMITELYVPRSLLPRFLDNAREDLRRRGASVIYGTVRLIERDTESFLRWAREPWACIVLNLCVEHSDNGITKARATFRQLIDRALELGGSYYLTYHRFARRDQVEAAYPQFTEFLKLKREWDPMNRFQSDWFCHYQALFLR